MKKIPLAISMDEDLAEWISRELENSEFRNKSHLVEQAIKDFLKEEQK